VYVFFNSKLLRKVGRVDYAEEFFEWDETEPEGDEVDFLCTVEEFNALQSAS